jgi:hypothetical protein
VNLGTLGIPANAGLGFRRQIAGDFPIAVSTLTYVAHQFSEPPLCQLSLVCYIPELGYAKDDEVLTYANQVATAAGAAISFGRNQLIIRTTAQLFPLTSKTAPAVPVAITAANWRMRVKMMGAV